MKDLEINLFNYLVGKYSNEIKEEKVEKWIEDYILIDHDEEDCHIIMYNADEEELEELKKRILIQLSKEIKKEYGKRN